MKQEEKVRSTNTEINRRLMDGKEQAADVICDMFYNGEPERDRAVMLNAVVQKKMKELYGIKGGVPHFTEWNIIHNPVNIQDNNPEEPIRERATLTINHRLNQGNKKSAWTHLDSFNKEDVTVEEEKSAGVIKSKEVIIQIDAAKEQAYYRERYIQKYLYLINNDYPTYYKNIEEIIKKSSLFFRVDLNYILLDYLMRKNTDRKHIGIEDVLLLECNKFLKFYEYDSKKQERVTKEVVKKVALVRDNANITFPIKFRLDTDESEETLIIEPYYIKLQLALLFYKDFQKLFQEKSKPSYSYEHILAILDNIANMSDEDEINEIGLDGEYEEILFPYIVERIMGINLCMQFLIYYQELAKTQEFKQNKAIDEKLKNILRNLQRMPNVFARIQIMREFMESVVFLNRDMMLQLTIVDNVIDRLCKLYQNQEKQIKNIFRPLIEEHEGELEKYLKKIRKGIKNYGIEDIKQNYTGKHQKHQEFLFTPEIAGYIGNVADYKMLQKIVMLKNI